MELKLAGKSLLRESKNCEKEEKAQKVKLKKAIAKSDMEVCLNIMLSRIKFSKFSQFSC